MSIDVETALRETLGAEAYALSVHDDPFPEFTRRERTHRRNRAVRLAAFAVVVLALVGVEANVIPIPGWVPGATAGHSARLAEGPIRGPLAGDRGFLDDFRDHLQDSAEDEGVWRVDRRAVDFVWAGDVPGARLVVADVPHKLMGITDWQLEIFTGEAGATGSQMQGQGNANSLGDTDQALGQVMTSDSSPGYAFVIGPVDGKVELTAGFRYGADGRVVRGKPVATGTKGVAIAALPPAPMESVQGTVFATVTAADGRTLYDGEVGGGGAAGSDTVDPEYTDVVRGVTGAMVTTALAGRPFDTAQLVKVVGDSLSQARLVASQVKLTIPWIGSIAGKPAAMWSLQPAGGGVLTFLFHGDDDLTHSDGAILQPAAGASDRPLGWRLRGEENERQTGRVAVIAPGAKTALLEVDGKAAQPVTLDASGFAIASAPTGATAHITVTLANGKQVRTLIPPFESTVGGIPGTTPGTTIVP